jgi:2-haloacid dehalogenase
MPCLAQGGRNMSITVAFDVYGTLIDTHGVILELQQMIGEKAVEFSRIWREKQLEYSFRRGLMQNYENFSVCTSNALDYTSSYFKASLTREQKDTLLSAYRILPAYSDVNDGLIQFDASQFRMFAFSNGSFDAIEMLLDSAGIRNFFMGVVSVDEVKSFKPNPGVYCHFLRKSGSSGSNAWMVSSNPFDVIGAVSAGMKAAWVQRTTETIFDPWGIEPTITVSSLSVLAEQIAAHSS